MSDLIPYGDQFEKIVDIIESAKERAYRKVNEELILMYRDIGEYISLQSENAEYGDAFVQKLADFFAKNYPELKVAQEADAELLEIELGIEHLVGLGLYDIGNLATQKRGRNDHHGQQSDDDNQTVFYQFFHGSKEFIWNKDTIFP